MTQYVSTPWPALNRHITLAPGTLTVLAGPPSVGSSMAALNIATHVGFDLDERVMIFSAEMSHDDTMTRIVAERVGVDGAKMHMGKVNDDELTRIKAYGEQIKDSFVELWPDAPVNLAAIRTSLLERAESTRPPRLVMVDGLHLVADTKQWRGSELLGAGGRQAVALKKMAEEYGVAVVATAHLDRRVVGRRPELADVETELAVAADVLLLLSSPQADVVEVEVAKNRNGASGAIVALDWKPEFARLRDMNA